MECSNTNVGFAVLLSLLFAACDSGPKADLVLRGGKVATVDADFSVEEAIAVQGDQIIFVGKDTDAALVRVKTREKRRPRRAASRGIVELGKSQAPVGQAVEMGSADFAAVASDIGETQIVIQDQENIRAYHIWYLLERYSISMV